MSQGLKILVLVLAVLVIFAIAGNFAEDSETKNKTGGETTEEFQKEKMKTQKEEIDTSGEATTRPSVDENDIQKEEKSFFEEKYMEGCVIQPNFRDYCECTYDYMIDTYGKKKVMEIGMEQVDRKAGEISPEMKEAVVECSNELPR